MAHSVVQEISKQATQRFVIGINLNCGMTVGYNGYAAACGCRGDGLARAGLVGRQAC